MTSKYRKNVVLDKSNVVSSGNVIYILNDDQDQHMPSDQQQQDEEVSNEVYQILSPHSQEENIYHVIETTDETIVGEEDGKEYTETITIVSEENDILGEEIIYVANEADDSGGGPVTFMQIGGPDVASEETIETSMIVEIPEDARADVNISHLTSDHCYTFKRGIKPKDLDKAKTKAAMLGEAPVQSSSSSSSSSQPYTFILPKNPTTQIIFQDSMDNPAKMFESKKYSGGGGSKETRCGKHRWLWQFMKELLFIGDTSLQWVNQREGIFTLRDQDQLAIKWECYKKMHNMKAQVWRQMRYYFGWMEENKIIRPVPDSDSRFQFVERFYREKFMPYKFKPHTDLKTLSDMAQNMDPSLDILSRYKNGNKEKVYCVRGCGSQFINTEACARHESVCTYSSYPS